MIRPFHMSPGPHQSPLTSGYAPHLSQCSVPIDTWKGNRLSEERQLVPSCCSADRCGRRRRQLAPVWRRDAAWGRFLIKDCLNAVPSLRLPLLIMQSISRLLPSALLLIIPDCSGGQGSERGDREWSHLLLPAAHARRSSAELTASPRGGALRASVMGVSTENSRVPELCLCSSSSIFWHVHVYVCMYRCMCTYVLHIWKAEINVGLLS